MSEKLYYINPYEYSWNAEVESVSEREGKFFVTLSKTYFYPEGGGQPSDRGKIDGIDITDVIEEDDVIYHVMPESPKNKSVYCSVDEERRLDHMQQHTGQHLLSAIFHDRYKGETSSFHLGEDYVSIDISLESISPSVLKSVEDEANSYILRNLEVKSYVLSPEEARSLPLRKLPPEAASIRIVEIDKIDYSPCCGTHIYHTGELGIIKILKTEKYKSSTRVYFKCGKRALEDYQNKNELVLSLARYFGVPESEILTKVQSSASELDALSKEIRSLKESLAKYEAAELLGGQASKLIVKSFDNKNFDELQQLSRQILEAGDYAAVLSSVPDKKLLFCQNGAFSFSCGKIFKEHLSKFNGRGGGGEKQAQAAFQSDEDMNRFAEFLAGFVK